MQTSRLSDAEIEERLVPPDGPVSLVLDTDTYNEIDDQFALFYALLSDRLTVEAVYAAPFHNRRSSGPADGMEKSYEEILRVMDRMGVDRGGDVFRGARSFLSSRSEPVSSSAVEDLIRKGLAVRETPLYVVAIGAITNIASALLLEPDLVRRVIVVWLGGHPHGWTNNEEFNLRQDATAAQVVFDSGVPLIHVPCRNVAEHIRTTLPEIERYVKGRGGIGDYLYEIYRDYSSDPYARSKVLWDIGTIAYLNRPEWMPSTLTPAPILNDDRTWGRSETARHPVRVATHANRDAIFADLFRKLEQHSSRS